jgi:uncharacterized membrane protein YsdA (DUF1294 family)
MFMKAPLAEFVFTLAVGWTGCIVSQCALRPHKAWKLYFPAVCLCQLRVQYNVVKFNVGSQCGIGSLG